MAKPVNVEVTLRPGEHPERMIKRFIRKIKKSGVMEEYRERRFHEKKSDKKRRIRQAQKRAHEREMANKKAKEIQIERGR
jgi:ribosomal protein S21